MIDAHVHLDDERFDCDRSKVIENSIKQGINSFIVPATGVWKFKKLQELSEQYPQIHAAYGLHPYFIDKHKLKDIEQLKTTLLSNQNCALGECGLDFFLRDLDQSKQLEFFNLQIEIAKSMDKPLILHARGAVEDVSNCLKEQGYWQANIHSYNGSLVQTKRLIERGVVFSFGGAICNPKATKLHKLLKYIPSDLVMFETDAPDQNPYPNFKERNTPERLVQIIETYSDITNRTIESVVEKSTEVASRFFSLKSH